MSTVLDSAAIESMKPTAVWRFFAGMAATPRPSKSEEKIRAHLRDVVSSLGFEFTEDAIGNIVVRVPASPGHEDAPITVLQAHMDMVCEKNAGTEHDFDNDPIRLILDRDDAGEPIVRADGTTLGADNGIGVAMALAAATERDVVHGPLELLITVDEEMGMTGANALTPTSFAGRRLLNLDSEEDNALYMGCAGGCDTNFRWDLPMEPVTGGEACRVTVNGLRGGHSGGDIHENRGNANRLLVRTLLRAGADGLRLAEIHGGSKRNAIPREAHAVVWGPPGTLAALQKAAERVTAQAREESDESGAGITAEPATVTSAATADDSRRLLSALAAIPSGVLGMNHRVPDLVQTSNNLSTIASDVAGDSSALTVHVGTLTRSSSESRTDEVLDTLQGIAALAGAQVSHANRYPGWEPNPDSATLAVCRWVYRECFGSDPHVAAIHAGLECGIIGRRVGGGMDMVSFGPRIEGAHSPDERVWVQSVEKSWSFLRAVLAELARAG